MYAIVVNPGTANEYVAEEFETFQEAREALKSEYDEETMDIMKYTVDGYLTTDF
jgi:hypothetical protein